MRLNFFFFGIILPIAVVAEQAILQPSYLEHDRSQERINAIKHDAFFIFNSILHLLRLWGNALAPNGLSYTYATIPAHTPLFHARKTAEGPDGPEWFAFEPQLSIGVMLTDWGETFLRIYTTNRDLKVLYVDGMSAALTTDGTLDSQDILAFEKIFLDQKHAWDDYKRAQHLCEWGKRHGIEGFMRGNTGFELMWCDFNVGVELRQNLNVSEWYTIMTGEPLRPSPWGPSGPPDCPFPPRNPESLPTSGCPTRLDFIGPQTWEWLRAGTEVYSGAGEERAILDTSRFVTAYGEVGLSGTLDPFDMSKHRLINITDSVASFYRSQIAKVSDMSQDSSGIDWRRIADTITARYGRRIPEIRGYLANGTVPALRKARLVAIGLVMPLTTLTNTAEEDLEQCTRAFTSSIGKDELSWSEYKLLVATEMVHGEICRTVYPFYRAIRDLPPSSPPYILYSDIDPTKGKDWSSFAHEWKDKFTALEKRLDWAMWRACPEKCKPDEVCYLPTWPVAKALPDDPIESFEPFCVNIDWFLSS